MPVETDLESIRTAAELGNAHAQCDLGHKYFYGQGVPKDYTLAMTWLRKAADQNFADAQFKLGFMYTDGRGVAKDYSEALKWFRLAADQGNAGGQWGLGHLYDAGAGVPRDSAEASKWYRKAAEQGDTTAAYNLGLSYEYGDGVPQDDMQAHMWFCIAACTFPDSLADIYNGAIRRRDRVAAKLTEPQLAESRRLAREWMQSVQPAPTALPSNSSPDRSGVGYGKNPTAMHRDAETVVFRQDFFDDGSSEITIVVSTKLALKDTDTGYDKSRVDELRDWALRLVEKTPGATGVIMQASDDETGSES